MHSWLYLCMHCAQGPVDSEALTGDVKSDCGAGGTGPGDWQEPAAATAAGPPSPAAAVLWDLALSPLRCESWVALYVMYAAAAR